MNIIKILSKLGLVKITEYNWHDAHIIDWMKHVGLSSTIEPETPKPLLRDECGF